MSTSRSFVGSSSSSTFPPERRSFARCTRFRSPPERSLDPLLLVAAPEVEPRDVLPRVHLALAELDRVLARRRSPSRPCSRLRARPAPGRRTRAATVSPTSSVPASGCSSPAIMRNSVVLPAPFGPITPTIPPGGSVERQVLDEEPVAEALLHVLGADDDVAEPRARRGCGSRRRRASSPGPRRGASRRRRAAPSTSRAAPSGSSAPTRARAGAYGAARRSASPRSRAAPASARATRSSCPGTGCPRPRSSSRIQPATLSRK